jgi:hypothetical protein
MAAIRSPERASFDSPGCNHRCPTQIRERRCRRSPVGTAEFSRGRKPTEPKCHRRVSRVAAAECGGQFMSPLRGLRILRYRRRGLAPTAKLYRRYAAGLTRCVGQRGCKAGFPGRHTTVALKERHSPRAALNSQIAGVTSRCLAAA